jgi:hypothetical protein
VCFIIVDTRKIKFLAFRIFKIRKISGGHERGGKDGRDVYHSTAMTLVLDAGRPVIAQNLKFLKIGRAGAVTLLYGGKDSL